MKNILKYLAVSALSLGILVACSPEAIEHPTEFGLPNLSNYEPVISVDQEINQVTFSVDAKGVIPVWVFTDKNGEWTQYAAQNGLKKIFASSGDYGVRMHLMNSNGISPDYKEASFHINNTIMNFDKYLNFLAGGKDDSASKEWRIDNDAAGHMACGDPGTDGTNWWSAAANEKKDYGVYDDRLTFTGGYGYTYDPGEGGTVYVNKDVTAAPFGDYRNPDEDYMVPVDPMTTTFSFEVEGEDLYLVLPEGTLFPYIANDSFVANPRFKVKSITSKAAELVIDNGAIAWHYTLTSGAAAQVFNGYKYNSDFNIWKKSVDDGDNWEFISTYYAHGGGWETNPDAIEYSKEGSTWTVTLPDESDQQWQAQLHIGFPELEISSAKNYDFSCIIQSNNKFLDGTGITFKIVDNANDGLYLIAPVIPVTNAYEDIIYYETDIPGVDIAKGSVKVAFDFGGCRAGTEITIKNIVLKDHADDDGTVLPSDDPDPEPEPVEEAYFIVNGATNLWKSATITPEYWYSPADWSGGITPNAELTAGNGIKVVIPEGTGGSEWMGQTKLISNIASTPDELYDLCCTFIADEDMTVTIKLTGNPEGDGDTHAFFYDGQVALSAGEEFTYKKANITNASVGTDNVMLIFDFGRSPVGSTIEVKDICFQKHMSPGARYDTDSSDNLWKGTTVTTDYWYSPSDWSGGITPEIELTEGNGVKVVIPEGTGGSEWMGQTKLISNIASSADKLYDFCCTLVADEDMTVTIKLTGNPEGEGDTHAFFYDGQVTLSAGEELTYEKAYIANASAGTDNVMLIFDFGRSPVGSTVEVKNICFQEHIDG